jgi:hypothetical protein
MNELSFKSPKTSNPKGEKSSSHKAPSFSHPAGSPAGYVLNLQRTIGNRAVTKLIESGQLQAKLKIGRPNDRYEQEADTVADKVMRMPETKVQRECQGCEEEKIQTKPLAEHITPLVQRQGTEEEKEEEPLQTKRTGDNTSEGTPSIESQISSLRGGGRALSSSERAFFEPRFGHDFGGVRIHAGTSKSSIARSINAKAFTSGSDVVFGEGEYSPGTPSGQRLLAHELTHVVQQNSGRKKSIQRAEVDDRSNVCSSLIDIKPDVNSKVTTEIAAARTALGTTNVQNFLRGVELLLGGRGPISPIERHIEAMPATKRVIPPQSLSGTRYQGAESVNRFWLLHTLGAAHVAGAAAKIDGICVGTDKLGHFFQQGYQYYERARSTTGGTTAAAVSMGRSQEIGISGLAATGVYSNADLAANKDGLAFYDNLAANPATYSFDISNYINNNWSEEHNSNYYEPNLANIVWRNLLNGAWEGQFDTGSGSSFINIQVNLVAPSTGPVTGAYAYAQSSSTVSGTITNGVISQVTTAVSGTSHTGAPSSASPVSGIAIDFDWQQGGTSGKGRWTSSDEQTLHGTWGNGSSRTDGGIWNIIKI